MRAEGFIVATYVVVSKKVEGAKEFVILEVKGAGGLEVAAEGRDAWGLDGLFGRTSGSELLMVVRSGRPRRPPRTAVGVVVLRVVHVGGGMLRSAVIEV